jgi:DMSO reductase anchor subunit
MEVKLSSSVTKVEVVASTVESTSPSEAAHSSKASRALARGGKMVRVHTRAGVSYLGHAVIVTVPLGVLQTKVTISVIIHPFVHTIHTIHTILYYLLFTSRLCACVVH